MAELYHHGIQGMKWGVRRYQNEDGSLTEAGRARYGSSSEHKDNIGRRALTGRSLLGYDNPYNSIKGARDKRSERLSKKAEKAASKGNEERYNKMKAKEEAQRAANANREAYDRHTSTGKMFAQNLLFSGWGGERYRNARARGEKRARAVLEAMTAYTITGKLIERAGEKKAYGEATWGAM